MITFLIVATIVNFLYTGATNGRINELKHKIAVLVAETDDWSDAIDNIQSKIGDL